MTLSSDLLVQILEFAAAVALTGAVSGFLAGLFGIGGGAVIVPVLYQVLGAIGVDEAVRMHVALGSSMAIVLPTAVRSVMAHHARGTVDMAVLRAFAVGVPLGVAAASLVVAAVSGAGLRAIFAAAIVLISLKMLLGRASWRLGDTLPGRWTTGTVGLAIGFLSTLMGVGGGVFSTLYLTLFGRPVLQAISTSAGVGVLIAVPGTIGYMIAGWGRAGLPPFSIGYVNVVAVALVIPVALLATPLGVAVAHRLDKRRLEVLFGLFLLAVATRFVVSLLP